MFNRSKIAKLLSVILCISVLLCSIVFSASAASSVISFSKSTVTVGDTFTVTVKFSGSNLGALDAKLTYNSDVVEYVSGSGTNGGGGTIMMSAWAWDANISSLTITMTFKAKAAGSSKMSVTNIELTDFDEKPISCTAGSNTVTVKSKVVLSSNANLTSMKLSSGTLSPAFSPNTVSYKVSVPYSTKEMRVTVTTAESAAKVSISGSSTLSVGTNKRVITVTAPNGSTKRYTLTITRAADPNASSSTGTSSAPVSSSVSSTTPEPQQQILVTAGDKTMVLHDDLIGLTLPEGFTADVYDYAGQQVTAAVNGNVVLMYLTDENDENGNFYIYNSDTVSFYEFNQISISTGKYTVLERRMSVQIPAGYSETTIQINGKSVTAWTNDQKSDFYLIYAMSPDGNCGLYRYDSAEATLQRYTTPESTATDEVDKPTEQIKGDTYLELILIIVSAVLLAACISLAVILIIKTKRR